MNPEILLGVRELRVDFRVDAATTLQAVKGIAFDIPANSTVALVGESGSGKSVTALAILGLLPEENSSARGEVGTRDAISLRSHPASCKTAGRADI
jgi:ABC-type glutathione transport system ATPase component